MFPFPDDLDYAASKLADRVQRYRGQLGFVVRGVYTVLAVNKAKFYVRLETGELVQAYHRSRVPPLPDLDVWIIKTPNQKIMIDDVDWERAETRFGEYAATVGVGLHTHARFSGMEFPIATRLLEPLQLRWSGLTISLAAGFYVSEGETVWWPGTATLDISSEISVFASYNWMVVGIDSSGVSPVLTVVVQGTGVATRDDLAMDDLAALVTALDPAILPVAAIRASGHLTAINEHDVESLLDLWEGNRPFVEHLDDLSDVSVGAAIDGDLLAFAAADNSWENEPLQRFTDRIVTGHTGQVLTGHTGKVLIGPPL